MSDSHGNLHNLEKIIKNEPKADIFLHLGDTEPEVEALIARNPDKDIRYIRGNNDYVATAPLSLIIDTPGARIFACHGNRQRVYDGTDVIRNIALKNNCNIACFGHTHKFYYAYDDGVHILNPGSCARPRDSHIPTYAFCDITDAGIVIGKKNII
jgi:putative phosphoesterase